MKNFLGSYMESRMEDMGQGKFYITLPCRARERRSASFAFRDNGDKTVVIGLSYNSRIPACVKRIRAAKTLWEYGDGHGMKFACVCETISDEWEIDIWYPGHHGHGQGKIFRYSNKGEENIQMEIWDMEREEEASTKETSPSKKKMVTEIEIEIEDLLRMANCSHSMEVDSSVMISLIEEIKKGREN